MKNKLSNLNDHLFAQLERLGDESLDGDKLAAELKRSREISGIAKNIVMNARLVLDAEKARRDGSIKGGADLVGIEYKGGEK